LRGDAQGDLDIFDLNKLVGVMAQTVPTAHKEHGYWAQLRQDYGVVTGAAG
jgi:hypothetical protein